MWTLAISHPHIIRMSSGEPTPNPTRPPTKIRYWGPDGSMKLDGDRDSQHGTAPLLPRYTRPSIQSLLLKPLMRRPLTLERARAQRSSRVLIGAPKSTAFSTTPARASNSDRDRNGLPEADRGLSITLLRNPHV